MPDGNLDTELIPLVFPGHRFKSAETEAAFETYYTAVYSRFVTKAEILSLLMHVALGGVLVSRAINEHCTAMCSSLVSVISVSIIVAFNFAAVVSLYVTGLAVFPCYGPSNKEVEEGESRVGFAASWSDAASETTQIEDDDDAGNGRSNSSENHRRSHQIRGDGVREGGEIEFSIITPSIASTDTAAGVLSISGGFPGSTESSFSSTLPLDTLETEANSSMASAPSAANAHRKRLLCMWWSPMILLLVLMGTRLAEAESGNRDVCVWFSFSSGFSLLLSLVSKRWQLS